MAQSERYDSRPGVRPETRCIAGGAVALIMPIFASHMTPASAQLVLRCEPDGQIYAAIGPRMTSA